MVSGLGAGTTLEGILIPIKEKYPGAELGIAEHALSPLLARTAKQVKKVLLPNIQNQDINPAHFKSVD